MPHIRQKALRKRRLLFLFLFLICIGIGIGVSLMDSNNSLNAVNKVYYGKKEEPKNAVDKIEKNEKNIKEKIAEIKEKITDSETYEQATDLIKDLKEKEEEKPKESINNNMEDTTKPKEKKGLLDYWWALVGVYFFFKMIFGSD